MTLQITSSSIRVNNGANTFKFDADDRLMFQRASYSGSGVTINNLSSTIIYTPSVLNQHMVDVTISNLLIEPAKDVVVGTVTLTGQSNCNMAVSMLNTAIPINQGIPVDIDVYDSRNFLVTTYLAVGLMKGGLTAHLTTTEIQDWVQQSPTYSSTPAANGGTSYYGRSFPYGYPSGKKVVFNYNLKIFRYTS
jgi:hypothetical protein